MNLYLAEPGCTSLNPTVFIFNILYVIMSITDVKLSFERNTAEGSFQFFSNDAVTELGRSDGN